MQRASQNISRRKLLRAAAHMACSTLIVYPLSVLAYPRLPVKAMQNLSFSKKQNTLSPHAIQKITFFHTHTHERLTINHVPGQCTLETRQQLDFFLRDFRTGDVHPIDTALIDTLYHIQEMLKGRGVFEVISGYRSLKTNQYLLRQGSGVSKRSLHMQGRAIDIRLSGLHTRKLRDTAIKLAHGGVGYYPSSDFVHLDTGQFRTW